MLHLHYCNGTLLELEDAFLSSVSPSPACSDTRAHEVCNLPLVCNAVNVFHVSSVTYSQQYIQVAPASALVVNEGDECPVD